MAEMDTSSGGGHKKGPGVKKSKKLSTRVDLTPMVDLGFLLITFFIFTTTMSQPTAMKLILPKDADKPEEQNLSKESGTLTIMMGKDNHVFYYEGSMKSDGSNFKTASFSGDNSIRNEIIKKRSEVMGRAKAAGAAEADLDKDLVIVIKPNSDCNYKNVVDMLDEMAINGIKRYALVDIAEGEIQAIGLTEGAAKQ
jgi:biopolymer transport protein ExbD